MVECTGLENRRTERYRGFESLSLRNVVTLSSDLLFSLRAPQSQTPYGEMAEWSNAPVLKTGVLRGTGGSNPSLSAINAENQQIIKQTPNFTPKNVKLGVFILFKTNHIRSENNLIKNRTNEKNNQFIFRKISYLCSK